MGPKADRWISESGSWEVLTVSQEILTDADRAGGLSVRVKGFLGGAAAFPGAKVSSDLPGETWLRARVCSVFIFYILLYFPLEARSLDTLGNSSLSNNHCGSAQKCPRLSFLKCNLNSFPGWSPLIQTFLAAHFRSFPLLQTYIGYVDLGTDPVCT